MNNNLEQFNRDLDQLINHGAGSSPCLHPALESARVLLELDLKSEAQPPQELGARWAARTHPNLVKERKYTMKSLRARPLAAILIALLVLMLISSVVYAVGKSWGYFPGLGLVEQEPAFLVLAEPISQTRDGVTITVETAVINADNLLLTYKVEGLSDDKYSALEPLNSCMSSEEVRFSNGESLIPFEGISQPLEGGFESVYKFTPIPDGTKPAAFIIPCIQGALTAGVLPENWEFPLHFVPAPEDMALTLIPVTEIAPSPTQTPQPGPTSGEATPTPEMERSLSDPFFIDQVIDAGNSYILIGEFNPPTPAQAGEWSTQYLDLQLTGANGQEIDWQPPFDIILPTPSIPNQSIWAVTFSKEFTPPVHLVYRARTVFRADLQQAAHFEFDAGENPQLGQTWEINKEFQFAENKALLTKIKADLNGYFFFFESEDGRINHLSVQIEGYTPTTQGNDAGSSNWGVYLFYPEMPTGKLQLILDNVYLNGETGEWALDWQP